VAGRGGYRVGAGRPPKRVINETPIRDAERKILDRLPWIVDKLFELVEGIHEERTIGDGAVVVYKRAPDRQSAEYLIDRVMGKATQPIDVSYQVEEIASEYGVEPERVTSIMERLKARRAG
jgi:hypothetical protein